MTVIDDAQRDTIPWDGQVHSYRPDEHWQSRISPELRMFSAGDEEIDPITFEVIRHRLWMINSAHGETLQRVSGSPMFQILDFNMCIMTAEAEVVMNAPYFQHLNSGAPLVARYVLEHFSGDPGIREGDIFLCNDPWIGVVHQPDVCIAMPIFVDGELMAWVTNAAHQIDLGGTAPGGFPQNATNVFHDPVVLPPMKIVEGGKMRADVERAYLRQSRLPDLVALDLRAQIAGVRFAHDEILRACADFGAATVRGSMDRVIDSAQEAFKKKLSAIPDGTWTQVRYMDEKLPGDRGSQRVQINLHKVGDRLRIDNRGSDAQVDGPNGMTYCCFKGTVLGAITLSMLYEQLFAAGGADRQIDWDVEPGTVTCVDWPAAVSAGSVQQLALIHTAYETVSKMLACAPGYEGDVQAAATDANAWVLFGVDEGGVQFGAPLTECLATGRGGRAVADGLDLAGYVYSPLSRYPSTEESELFYPMVYLYRKQLTDSPGAGEFRGGGGMAFAVAGYKAGMLGIMTAGASQSTTTHGAPGLFGGYPAPTAELRVLADSDVNRLFKAGTVPTDHTQITSESDSVLRNKTEGLLIGNDDVVAGRFGGGGGLGDPLARPAELVAVDVQEGWVSAGAARSVYGVVLDENGDVADAATAELRRAVLARRKNWEPVSSRWPSETPIASTPATGEPARPVHAKVQSIDSGAERVLACTCGQVLAPYQGNYKHGLLVEESPVTEVPLVQDPSIFLDEPTVFRKYACPGCQALLATEIIRPGERPVADMLFAALDPANR
jgi:N-methylhydantoinase B